MVLIQKMYTQGSVQLAYLIYKMLTSPSDYATTPLSRALGQIDNFDTEPSGQWSTITGPEQDLGKESIPSLRPSDAERSLRPSRSTESEPIDASAQINAESQSSSTSSEASDSSTSIEHGFDEPTNATPTLSLSIEQIRIESDFNATLLPMCLQYLENPT
jgi:hypothetical protein